MAHRSLQHFNNGNASLMRSRGFITVMLTRPKRRGQNAEAETEAKVETGHV